MADLLWHTRAMSRFALVSLLVACTTTPPPSEPTRTASARSMYIQEPGTSQWPPMISGNTAIVPDRATIEAASVEYARLMSSWKLCIDETGAVSLVEKLRSSGFPDYDAAIRRELSSWKFQAAAPACKAISLVYELPATKT